MKFIILLFLLSGITFGYSQEEKFIFLNQEIDSILERDGYNEAKKILKQYTRKYTVQPSVIRDFLGYSLEFKALYE